MKTEAMPSLISSLRRRPIFFVGWLVGLLAFDAAVRAADAAATRAPSKGAAEDSNNALVFSLLPKSLQARPLMDFNVITEMTPEGRKLTPPSPENPVYYVEQPGAFVQTGSALTDGEKAPPVADLEQAMQKALASTGYRLSTAPEPRPSLVVVFNYGSHGADFAADFEAFPPPVSAEDLIPIVANDVALQKDLLERAAMIGGMAFAAELKRALIEEVANMKFNHEAQMHVLPTAPELGSPFHQFVQNNGSLVAHLVEDAFHSCYFVIASAYDYADLSRGRKRLLWRTKMTVDAGGVNMKETLAPLIASAAPYFGKDMSEAAVVSKRLSREGRVEIGTATVVEEKPAPKPAAPATNPKPKEP